MGKRKAADGTGTIRHRSDGRWEARFIVGTDPGTGKTIRRSIYGKTQKEVASRMKQEIADLDNGTYITPSDITVGSWVKTWIEVYAKNKVKPYTLSSYNAIYNGHIKPRLGAVPLQKLNGTQVQKFYNDLLENGNTRTGEGVSGKTVKNIHAVLHKSLTQAIKLGYIKSNPCDAAELPSVQNKEIHPLTEAEIPTFLKAIENSKYRNLFAVMLFCGLREGEALGLDWNHIDLEKQSIVISQQLQRDKEKGGEYRIQKSTKNDRPRTIAPPPIAFNYIRAERSEQNKSKLIAGDAWCNEWDLVFTDKVGNHLAIHTVYKEFKRIAEQIGRPDLRPHDLRHTCATVALASGSDVKSVQSLMGHATASFTLDRYAHATEQMKQDTANKMQAFYDRIRA